MHFTTTYMYLQDLNVSFKRHQHLVFSSDLFWRASKDLVKQDVLTLHSTPCPISSINIINFILCGKPHMATTTKEL